MKQASSARPRTTAAPASLHGAKGRATYEALLAAGDRLLVEHGPTSLTSTAVAAEAGVATGTFYTYFADKDALLAALFARRLDELATLVDAELSAEALLDRGLRGALDGAVEAVVAGYRAHSAVIRAALGRVPDSPVLRDVYWARHATVLDGARRFIERGARAGLVRDGDSQALAQALLVVVQGLNHPVVLAGRPAEVRALAAHVAEALHGMLSPSRPGDV
jgi:TetR/AcrR family fatty acid metabolism transcriptional regulator